MTSVLFRFFTYIFFILVSTVSCTGYSRYLDEVLPEFYSPLENITAIQGRDIHFTCIVNHLGNYRVAWIKSDNKAILAIHNRLVTHNPRLSVTHNGHNTWKLYVYNVQKNDSGTYMCQINTEPMMSQLGYLNITVPPDILNDEPPPEGYQALEGGTIKLRCRATGDPEPEISWKREDGKPIIVRQDDKKVEMHRIIPGENLTLTKVNRSDMGAYLCLARSSVPPIMSKRFFVDVNFKPSVEVMDQLVAAPVSKDVTIQCKIEASPQPTYQWINSRGEPVISGRRMNVTETSIESYTTLMSLQIRSLEKRDFGEYSCVSENTIGRAEGKVKLQELYVPEKTTSSKPTYYTNRGYADRKNPKQGNRWSFAKKPVHEYKSSSTELNFMLSTTTVIEHGFTDEMDKMFPTVDTIPEEGNGGYSIHSILNYPYVTLVTLVLASYSLTLTLG